MCRHFDYSVIRIGNGNFHTYRNNMCVCLYAIHIRHSQHNIHNVIHTPLHGKSKVVARETMHHRLAAFPDTFNTETQGETKTRKNLPI